MSFVDTLTSTLLPSTVIRDRMTYELYWSPTRLSMVIHWLLIELADQSNVEYKLHELNVEEREHKEPAYLELNPKGQIPTLMVDGQPYSETVALLLILSERHPELNWAPKPNEPNEPTRAKFLETIVFLANPMLSSLRDLVYSTVDGSEDPAIAQAIRDMAKRRLYKGFEMLDQQLSGRDYLIGDGVTVADFLLTCLARYSRKLDRPATSWGNIKRLTQKMTKRESWLELNKKEGLLDGEKFWPWNYPEAL